MSIRRKQIYLAIAAFGFLLSAALFGLFFGITPARAADSSAKPERLELSMTQTQFNSWDTAGDITPFIDGTIYYEGGGSTAFVNERNNAVITVDNMRPQTEQETTAGAYTRTVHVSYASGEATVTAELSVDVQWLPPTNIGVKVGDTSTYNANSTVPNTAFTVTATYYNPDTGDTYTRTLADTEFSIRYQNGDVIRFNDEYLTIVYTEGQGTNAKTLSRQYTIPVGSIIEAPVDAPAPTDNGGARETTYIASEQSWQFSKYNASETKTPILARTEGGEGEIRYTASSVNDTAVIYARSAGTYTIRFEAKEGFQYKFTSIPSGAEIERKDPDSQDSPIVAVTYTWVMQKAALTSVSFGLTGGATEWTYDGDAAAHAPTDLAVQGVGAESGEAVLVGENGAAVVPAYMYAGEANAGSSWQEGGQMPADGGSYTVRVSLTGMKNYLDYETPAESALAFSIARAEAALPVVPQTSFPYSGQRQSPQITHGDESLYDTENIPQTVAGKYSVTFTLKSPWNHYWAGQDLSAGEDEYIVPWEIVQAQNTLTLTVTDGQYGGALPTLGAELDFGETASIDYIWEWRAYGTQESDFALAESPLAGTPAAGYYRVTGSLTGTENYADATATKMLQVERQEVDRPVLGGWQGDGFVYDGTTKEPTAPSSQAYAQASGGTASATDAGEYFIRFALGDNYRWKGDGNEGERTYDAPWKILRKGVEKPAGQTVTYSGAEQQFAVQSSAYAVTSEARTDAGRYDVEFTLDPNYCWGADGSADTGVFTLQGGFVIERKTVAKPTMDTSDTEYTMAEQTKTAQGYDASLMQASFDGTSFSAEGSAVVCYATGAGTYTLTFALKDTNHAWEGDPVDPSAGQTVVTLQWTIQKADNAVVQQSGDPFENTAYEGWQYGKTPTVPEKALSARALLDSDRLTIEYKYYTAADSTFQNELQISATSAVGDYVLRAVVPAGENTNPAAFVFYFTIAPNNSAIQGETSIEDPVFAAADAWYYKDDPATHKLTFRVFVGDTEITSAATVQYYTAGGGSVSDLATAGAGEYYAEIVVEGTPDYTGTNARVSFTIKKYAVAVPEFERDREFDETEWKPAIAAKEGFDYRGATWSVAWDNEHSQNVGNYWFTLTLDDAANYEWGAWEAEAAPGTADKDTVGGAEARLWYRITSTQFSMGLSLNGWVYGAVHAEPAYTHPEGAVPNDLVTFTFAGTTDNGAEFSQSGTPDTVAWPTQAGEYTLTVSIAPYGNYDYGTEKVTFTVAPYTLTPAWSGTSHAYGAVSDAQVSFEGQYQAGDEYASLNITLTYAAVDAVYSGSGTPKNAGTYSATVTLGNKNYCFGEGVYAASESFTVAKAVLTLAANEAAAVYGTAAEDIVWQDYRQVSGLVEGDDLAVVLASVQFTYTARGYAAGSAVGTYDVAMEADADSVQNYTLAFDVADGAFTVTQRTLTVNIQNPAGAVYTGKAIVPTYSDDRFAGDDLQFTYTYTAAGGAALGGAPVDVGSYTVTVTLTGGANSGNYAFEPCTGEQYTIAKAVLTLAANEAAAVYGTAAEDIAWQGYRQVSGLVEGDDLAAVLAGVQFTYTAQGYAAGSAVGTYDVAMEADTDSVQNYTLAFEVADGAFTVTQRTLTVNIQNPEGAVYTGEAIVPTYAFENVFGEDEIAIVCAYYRQGGTALEGAPVDAGEYYAVVALGADMGNYVLADGSVQGAPYTVAKAALSVTIADFTAEYCGAAYGIAEKTGATANVPERDRQSVAWTFTADSGEVTALTDAGTYTVQYTVTADNHEAATGKVTFTITKAQLTLTINAVTAEYGTAAEDIAWADGAAGVTAEGLVGTDVGQQAAVLAGIQFTYTAQDYTAGAQGGGVGTYFVSLNLSAYETQNYIIQKPQNAEVLTVTARPITVSLLDGSSTYGDAVDLYAQANVSGGALAGGDTKEQVFLLTGYTEEGEPKPVQDADTYYIVGSPNASAAGGNYAITFVSAGGHTVTVGGERYPAGKYTVSQQTVSVTLTGGGNHTFNGAPKTVKASYSETGITITVWYTGTGDTEYASAEAPVNVGTYHVTCMVDDPNYSAASVSTDLTILPKTITIEWAADAYTYNGEVQAVTALYEDVGGAEHSLALTITEGGAQFRDAGTYTFKAAFAEGDNKQGNYALPDDPTKAYNIAPYAVTVHIDDASSEYGDPIAALTAQETENAVFACDRAAGDAWWSNVFVLSTTAKQGFAASDAVTTYTISASAEGTARGTNYAFTFEGSLGATAQYTVTKRVLTVCVQGFTVAYGDAVNEEGIVLLYERKNGAGEAFYGDDDESAVTRGTFSYAYTTKTAANTRVNVLPQGLTATNYAFEYTHNDYVDGAAENGGFTVTKRTVSVGGAFLARLTGLTYNAADRWSPVQTGDLGGKGLAAGESIGAELVFVYTFTYEGKTYEYDADSAPIRDAGEYTVTVALDSSSSNYALDKAYEDLAFSIAKAPLTVTADGDLQMEGVQDILVTYGEPLSKDNIRDKYLRYEGFCGEDTALLTDIRDGLGVSFAYISDKAGRTQAGTNVPVTLTACEAANYEVSVVNGNIAVQQRKISLAADESRYYNGYIDVYGEYGGTLNAFAAVVSGKMADGDTAAEQITFTYVYGGTANNGTDELTGTFVGGEFFADTAGIHAGEYTVTVSIQSTNYVIQDGATMQFTWRILKQRVADPAWESGSMIADGGEKTNAVEYSVALAEYVQAGGNPNAPASVENNTETGVLTMQATSAGVYWAEFRLRNEYDYVWTGNTGSTGQDNAVIRVQWSISQFTDLTVTVTGVMIGGERVETEQIGDRWWFVQGEDWTYGVTFGDFLYEATYNQGQPFQGSVQTSVYLVTGENTFESAGDYSQAGTYFVVAVIQASSDYAEARSERVYFTVLPQTLAVPTLENGVYAHGADVERPLSGFDAATMVITENNIGVRIEENTYYIFAQNAGTYYLRIVLTDGRNYRWEDGTANEQSLQWTIEQFKVTAPTLSADVSNAYSGQKQTYSYTDSEYKDYYHVAGTLSATDAGTYTVTAQLNDRSNYVWAGGGTADISVTWTIAQATNAWKTGADQYARAGWTYGQAVAEETLPVASFGEVIVYYYLDANYEQPYRDVFTPYTDAGTYYVVAEVAATENYTGLRVTGSFTIARAENNWTGNYSRADWTYGSAASAETLPTAQFGKAEAVYYTDADRTQAYTDAFGSATPAGTYYVTLTVESTGNHAALEAEASFTVNKAAAYAVWSDTSALVYDGQEKTVTASYSDVHGAPVALTVSVAQGVVLHADEYTAQAQFATEDEQNNYTLQNGQTAFTVSPKAITVNILPQGAVYSGAVPVPSQQEGDGYEFAVRPVGGDELNLSFALRDGKADVGTYVIVGAWNNADYAVTFAGGAFTVSPLEIVVTFASDMGGRYGSVTAASATAAKADGGAAVEGVLTLTYAGTPSGGAFTDYGTAVPQDAGAYTVTAMTDANHAIVGSNSAPFNIGKAQITVGDVQSVPYNGALQKAAIELTGAPESGVTVVNEGGVNAGNYNVLLTLDAEQANNYVWMYKGAEVGTSQLTVSFIIAPAQAEDNTVTIDVGSFEGWTFGESAALPEASAEFGSPVFYYSTERDGTYTAAVPVHAGTYWMKAVVEETVNNAASASQPVSFTVAAAQIASPAFAGGSVSVYSGAEQGNLFAGYDRSKMAIVSNDGALYSANGLYGLRATAAGEYAAVFRLVYADEYRDYVWTDSATDEVTVTWTIAKAQNGWKEGADQYIREGWKAGETAPAATLPEALFGEAVVRYYTDEACTQEYTGGFDGNTPAGTYYVLVEVAETENYEGISGAQAVRASFTVADGGSLVWLIAVLSCVLAAEVIMLICLLAKRRREVE